MNKIRAIQELNKKEIEQGISPNASWHTDYRDTAFIYFGGLPFELSEGDVLTIFSQFGEPVWLKLARDRDSGKSRGFGWLKYEDQRSTDLAVDNLGGAVVGGRTVSVDHARYKPRDDEDMDEGRVGWEDMLRREGLGNEEGDSSEEEEEEGGKEVRQIRPMLKEERELQLLVEGHDDDDPMKAYLVEEKQKEVDEALRRERKREEREKKHRSRRHHRSHHSRRSQSRDEEESSHRRRRRRDEERGESRERSLRDETPVATGERDTPPRERRRWDSRDRRDEGRRRHRDSEDRDRRHGRDEDRRRRGRETSEEYDGHRHRDPDRERRRRRDRSRSP